MSNRPVFQPTSKPQSSGIAYTEFLYVSLALILMIILICLMMCGFRKLCYKQSPCHKFFERNRNQRSDPNQDVEVIVETDAVVDNENLVECDVEAARNIGSNSFRDRGSLKRYGSWFGYGSTRRGKSLAVAQEYQGNPACEVGHAAPMRVMETFQSLSDYNANSVARALQAATATALRENRGGGGFVRQDHDYLIETPINTGEVNDQITRLAASNSQSPFRNSRNNHDGSNDVCDNREDEEAGVRETKQNERHDSDAEVDESNSSSREESDSTVRSISNTNLHSNSSGHQTRESSIHRNACNTSTLNIGAGESFGISDRPYNSIFARTSPTGSISM